MVGTGEDLEENVTLLEYRAPAFLELIVKVLFLVTVSLPGSSMTFHEGLVITQPSTPEQAVAWLTLL